MRKREFEKRMQKESKTRSLKCLYNGKTYSYLSLVHRLKKDGSKHANVEAKQYLIPGQENLELLIKDGRIKISQE